MGVGVTHPPRRIWDGWARQALKDEDEKMGQYRDLRVLRRRVRMLASIEKRPMGGMGKILAGGKGMDTCVSRGKRVWQSIQSVGY